MSGFTVSAPFINFEKPRGPNAGAFHFDPKYEIIRIMKLNHKVGFSSVIFAVVGVVFLVSTNPQNLAPILLIAPFILFFLSLLFAVVFVTTLMAKSDRPSITRKSFILTVLIAGYPVMLLLLQSIGQLSLRDVITLTLIVLLSGFYVTKSSFSS